MSTSVRAAVLGLFVVCPAATSPAVEGILAGAADPGIVATQDDQGKTTFYVASTGRGIQLWSSSDLKNWKRIGSVFDEDVPRWAQDTVPKSRGIWAPDLSSHNGLFHLYYSVSSFGSQRSVIGLAVNKTLDPKSKDYQWQDRGKVIESAPGECDFNAIDPALVVDEERAWHLFWGSFWSGIKAIRLSPETGRPMDGANIVPVAARPRHPTHAIEAPYVIFRDGYYYLFVSWDRCCDGADSDYKVMVGRSRKATGPYVDADGRAMLEGGGTLVLKGDDRWRGPGHNSVLTTDQGQWLVHHTYDLQNLRAQRILQIRAMKWSAAGWPEVGEPIFEPKAKSR